MSDAPDLQRSRSGALVERLALLMVGKTDAGGHVTLGRTWPFKVDVLPAIVVNPFYREDRRSLGKSAPQFDTVTTVVLRARTTAKGEADDAGGLALARALERLKRQIERTVVNAYRLMLDIEEFPTITAEFVFSTEGEQNVGELIMTIAMAFPEGPEDFAPYEVDVLDEVRIYPDLASPFDPSGTYTPQHPFESAVEPAPRTSGPDGRLEGGEVRIDTNPD